MLLKSIEYKNFRPFKGKQIIDFTRPVNKPNSNVIVILGDNTFGKSTIILSFIWCFYGKSKFNRPKEILNRDIEDALIENEKTQAQVTVVFEDEGIEYIARRVQVFTMKSNGLQSSDSKLSLTYIDKNGETQKCGKTEFEYLQAINAIIPEQLSSFFFFQGEKENNLTTKYLGDSVKSLLGLEAMAKMKEHLHGNTKKVSANSVMGFYESKQVDSDNTKAHELYEKKVQSENELLKIKSRLSEIDDQIESYNDKLSEINQILRDAAPTMELQKQRDTTAKELIRERNSLNQNYQRIIDDFNRDALSLLAYPLFPKAKKMLDKMDLTDKGIKGLEVVAIKELLSRGECLCGTDLKEGTLAYKNVAKFIDILPPKSVSTYVRSLLDSINTHENRVEGFIKAIDSDYTSIQFAIQKIDELERKEVELLTKLEQSDSINTNEYHRNIKEYKKRIFELRSERDTLIRKDTTLKNIILTYTNKFNMFKDKSDKNKIYKTYYQYAEAIYDWVSRSYDTKEAEMRDRLEESVAEMFNKMYSGKRDVEIDNNYNIKITVDGKALDDTGGLRILQYFSFVGGLVKLASKVMTERNDAEMLGEDYPLVLDAAFSHADENHVKSIAKELANSTKQLVLAVMSKDWNYAKEDIENRVGRMYELDKISETNIIIREA